MKTFFKNIYNKLVYFEVLRLKTQHFYTKLLRQKPVLRQIEWRIQNTPIKKNGVFPQNNLIFKKFN